MKIGALALGVLLTLASPVESHRLDEYLQATRLAFSHDRVVVELDLTPGVSVAPQIFEMVDRDGDALVSPIEIEDYARRVLQDLSLRIDGRPSPLTLVRAESPTWDEFREGLGTIRVEAFADAALMKGRHHIVYENAHEPAMGVYLVNALIPSTADVTIGAERRDALQRHIDLNVDVTPSFDLASWLILTSGAVAVVLMVRRYRPNSAGRNHVRRLAADASGPD
jgi:hypothetical protein